jgi:serine phosphatase RsbU (regulator of sigma subunit)
MKFGSNRLKETLDSIQQLTMAEQREKLNEAIENWRGDTEQIDDIIVLGVRI